MRDVKFLILFFIFTAAILLSSVADNQKSLADLYKTGEIRFVPEITLDDKSMPEGVFFESYLHISSDPEGNIYVFDYRANNIKKFDATGKFIKVIGREGQGPGEFSWPFFGAFTKDRLIVWDMRNRRLCALHPDGEFIKAERISFDSGSPQKIRSLPNGDVVMEKEKIFFGEMDRPQECIIELFSPGLEQKKNSVFS